METLTSNWASRATIEAEGSQALVVTVKSAIRVMVRFCGDRPA